MHVVHSMYDNMTMIRVTVRITEALKNKIQAMTEKMKENGMHVTESDIFRRALLVGLNEMEQWNQRYMLIGRTDSLSEEEFLEKCKELGII